MQENVDAGVVNPRQVEQARLGLALLAGDWVLAFDLITKWLLFARPELMDQSYLGGLFRFTDHRNYGITFDLPLPGWLIVIVTVVLLAVVALGIWRAIRRKNYRELAWLSVLFAGAVGNLIDRLYFGYVRDWILLWGRSAINLADLSIIAGLLGFLYLRSREEQSADRPSTS